MLTCPSWLESRRVGVVFEKGSTFKAVSPLLPRGWKGFAFSGHLWESELPDEVDGERFGLFSIAGLPILFDEVPKKVGKDMGGKSHAGRIKEFEAWVKGLDTLIDATDPGREGSLLFHEGAWHAGFGGLVLRLPLSETAEQSVARYLREMKPDSGVRDYAMALEGRERQWWDYHRSVNGVRIATNVLRPQGLRGVWRYGPMQTPALALLADHERRIVGHVARDYFGVEMTVIVKGSAGDRQAVLVHRPSGEARIFDSKIAAAIEEAARAWHGPLAVETKPVRRRPPRLHSKDSLAKFCAKKFGWQPDYTLKVHQEAYDKGYLSYPRTEGRYLPEALIPEIGQRLGAVAKALPGLGNQLPAPPVVRKGEKGVYVPNAGEHSAVIPTGKAPTAQDLSADAWTLYCLVARMYVAAHMEDAVDDRTTISAVVAAPVSSSPCRFMASGSVESSAGWRAAWDDGDVAWAAEEDHVPGKAAQVEDAGVVAAFRDGEAAQASKARTVTSVTQPPPRITLGELNTVLGRLVDQIDDPALKQALVNPFNPLELKGIGTAASRDEVAPALQASGYIMLLKGKDPPIQVTAVGFAYLDSMRSAYPEGVEAVSRARDELRLMEIGQSVSREDADCRAAGFRAWAVADVKAMVAAGLTAGSATVDVKAAKGSRPPSPEQRKYARALAEKHKVRLPRDVNTSSAACSAFIAQYAPARGEGADGNAPSPDSLKYAKNLAEETGLALPPEALTDRKICKAFIDKAVAARKPSIAQIKLAEKLAGEAGEELTPEMRGSFDKCKAYIDKRLGKKGGKR